MPNPKIKTLPKGIYSKTANNLCSKMFMLYSSQLVIYGMTERSHDFAYLIILIWYMPYPLKEILTIKMKRGVT